MHMQALRFHIETECSQTWIKNKSTDKSLRSSLCRTFLRQITVVSNFFMALSPFFFYGTGLSWRLSVEKHGYQAISIVDGQSRMIYKILVVIMLRHSLQRCFSYNGSISTFICLKSNGLDFTRNKLDFYTLI